MSLRPLITRVSAIAACVASLAATAAPHEKVPAMPVAAQKNFIEKYCADCHNPMDIRGNLMLDDLDVDNPGTTADLAEKVIRRVATGMMPPPDNPRPDDAAMRAFVKGLSQNVDAYGARNPDLGNPPLHRMNRTEYANSVRDLLGIEVDVERLLPSDDFSQGFDNMADVLGVSPTLKEAYVRAAGRISRQALGELDATPVHKSYQVPRVVNQVKRVDGAPLGTRGGISVMHDFPADGEYTFRVTFYHSIEGPLFGAVLGKTQKIEISINGEPIQVFDIDPHHTAFDVLETRPVPVKAGPQRVTAAFLVNADGPVEDAVQPFRFTLLDLNQATLSGLTTLPHVHELIIGGPVTVTGISDTPARRRVFSCKPANETEELPCARQILGRLATQAWRRPVKPEELDQLMQFHALGAGESGFEGGIGVALQAILSSPHFIYRFEHVPEKVAQTVASNPARAPRAHQISDLELASRLSYFLWSSAPDQTLLDLAAKGQLHRKSVLRAQVRRMLQDPRSISLAETFASQWLRLQGLKAIQPDGYLYPNYDKGLGEAMRQETVLLFDSIVREDQPVVRLLDANYTFVNEPLAALYGIPNVLGNRFRRVELTDENRFGLLGHASILALTSASNRTSPVMRGKYVMQTFLGVAPPPPPPDVPLLEEAKKAHGEDQIETLRTRLEEHRNNPTCAGCHKYIDPIGFALENFDPIGAWRKFESAQPIDAMGQLYDGTPLDGPAALRKALVKHSDDFLNGFAESLFAYGMGRVLRPADMPVVRVIRRKAAENGDTVSAYVLAIVESEPFRMRATPQDIIPGASLASRASLSITLP